MPADLGEATGPGVRTKTFEDGAGEDLTAGDVTAIDQSDGNVYKADTNDANRDQFAGVVYEEDASSGNTVTLAISAPGGIVAVGDSDASITAGARVGAPDSSLTNVETGEFVDEDGGPALALSDEGGSTVNGAGLAAGEIEVSY